MPKNFHIISHLVILDIEHQIAPKFAFTRSFGFKKKFSWNLGQSWQKLAEIGQKRDFIALFSEIYIKIEVFTSLELSYTSALIAQLVARLTFFIWIWPDQTWPERVRVQFPLEEHDFFFSFKLIILSFLCMHVYHIMIKSSQKLWAIYWK